MARKKHQVYLFYCDEYENQPPPIVMSSKEAAIAAVTIKQDHTWVAEEFTWKWCKYRRRWEWDRSDLWYWGSWDGTGELTKIAMQGRPDWLSDADVDFIEYVMKSLPNDPTTENYYDDATDGQDVGT